VHMANTGAVISAASLEQYGASGSRALRILFAFPACGPGSKRRHAAPAGEAGAYVKTRFFPCATSPPIKLWDTVEHTLRKLPHMWPCCLSVTPMDTIASFQPRAGHCAGTLRAHRGRISWIYAGGGNRHPRNRGGR